MQSYSNSLLLTHCDRVIDSEAAQDLIGVSGIQKSVASHNHLECLCKKYTPGRFKITINDATYFTNIYSDLFLRREICKQREMIKNCDYVTTSVYIIKMEITF